MISGLFKKFLKVFWFLPGFLLWASFPPMGEKIDVLFALAPLMWLSRRADAKTSAKRWFMSGIFFWVATLSWMPAIVKNGGPWPLVVFGWSVLAAYCALYFAAYGYLSAKAWAWVRCGGYWRRAAAVFFIEPVLWCGLELLRSRLGGGFAWNQFGVVAVNGGFGAPASLGGVYLVSAVIVLINGTVAGIAERVWKCELKVPRWTRPIETVLPFLLIFGLYKAAGGFVSAPESESRTPLKVAMVQRNFPCVFKDQDDDPYSVYGRLVANFAALRPELVVLPESAMCEFGPVDGLKAVAFSKWISDATGAGLLAGGSRMDESGLYNSAALYRPGSALQIYDKVHLVPFGEFIPGDKLIPALQKLAPVGSCTPGELKLLTLDRGEDDPLRIGVAICFEDTDSALMRRLAAMGAEVLVFITNDSWFSHSIEAEQHAWQARARALETGLPVVRVGNSGVTGTVTPSGAASWLVDAGADVLVDREGTMFDRIHPVRSTAPYVRCGDLPLALAFTFVLLAMFGPPIVGRALGRRRAAYTVSASLAVLFAFTSFSAQVDLPTMVPAPRTDGSKGVGQLPGDRCRVAFIGDDAVFGWSKSGGGVWYRLFKGSPFSAVNLGHAGDASENLLWRVENGLLDGFKAKAVVMHIGAVNIDRGDPVEDVVFGVKAVLDGVRRKQPAARVFLTAVLPRGREAASARRLERTAVNRELARYADDRTVVWCDFTDRLLTFDGRLGADISPDGERFSAVAYAVWGNMIFAHLDAAVEGRRSLGSIYPARADATFFSTSLPAAVVPSGRFGAYARHLGGYDWWAARVLRNRREILASGGEFDLVMLGDSITHYWERESPKYGSNVYARLVGKYRTLNCGGAGDGVGNVLWRVKYGELDGYRAKVVQLMIGTNDSYAGSSAEDVAAGVKAVLDVVAEKQPQAKVLLMPIFPRGKNGDGIRKRNEAVNRLIRAFADGKRVEWFDSVGEKLLSADGDVDPELAADRLHPTEKGYEIWFSELVRKMESICAK